MNQAQALCGLYYKHITILNDDSIIINKFETSLTDDARVIIYDHYMFKVKATVALGNAKPCVQGSQGDP